MGDFRTSTASLPSSRGVLPQGTPGASSHLAQGGSSAHTRHLPHFCCRGTSRAGLFHCSPRCLLAQASRKVRPSQLLCPQRLFFFFKFTFLALSLLQEAGYSYSPPPPEFTNTPKITYPPPKSKFTACMVNSLYIF